MYYHDNNYKKMLSIIGALIGAVIFILIYGIKILNPFYIDWLMCTGKFGDLQQHYLGWEFYRRGPWTFPLGLTDQLAYPIETSVVFTDSIPILAVIFKVFRDFLPKYFQYFGLWGLFCFCMQGFLASKIFNEWNLDWQGIVIGDIFIIVSPIVLYRMFVHTALAAQWIILFAIYLFLRQDSYSEKKSGIFWGILGFLTVGVHLYFFPMCFLFVLGSSIKYILKRKRITWVNIFPVISYSLAAGVTLYILGGFSSKAIAGSVGLTECSLNLNSFFNPMNFSCILPNIKWAFGGQHEGFAYLGLGLICIIVFCIFNIIIKMIQRKSWRSKKQQNITNWILICIGVIYTFIAVSPTVTFGDKILMKLPIPKIISQIWAVFRATGRFIWPAWYMIVIYCIVNIWLTSRKKKISIGILIICLFIQLLDLSKIFLKQHEMYTKEFVYEYTYDEFWEQLMAFRNFTHLNVCNPHLTNEMYNKLAALALRYDMTINAFGFARKIEGVWENQEILKREDPKSDSVYILFEEQRDLLKDCEHVLRYYNMEEYVVGVSWLDDKGNVNNFSYELY